MKLPLYLDIYALIIKKTLILIILHPQRIARGGKKKVGEHVEWNFNNKNSLPNSPCTTF
jgi:hypothetical protein